MALFNKETKVIHEAKETNEYDLKIAAQKAEAELEIAEANKSADRILAEEQIARENKQDKIDRPWAYDNNFRDFKYMKEITFPDKDQDTIKTIEKIAVKSKVLLNEYIKSNQSINVMSIILFGVYKWVFSIPSIIQAYTGVPKISLDADEVIKHMYYGHSKLSSSGDLIKRNIDEIHELNESLKKNEKKFMNIKLGALGLVWISIILMSVIK
jgi:hypothetical protein